MLRGAAIREDDFSSFVVDSTLLRGPGRLLGGVSQELAAPCETQYAGLIQQFIGLVSSASRLDHALVSAPAREISIIPVA